MCYRNIQASILEKDKYKQEMAKTQALTQAKRQAAVVAAKALVEAMAVMRAEADNGPRSEAVSVGHRLGRPLLKQLSYDWSPTSSYEGLRNFRLEANNIFQTYDTNHEEFQLLRAG